MTFKIGDRLIGVSHKPFIIAEISANHNGSLERCLATIEAAKKCGADAVKIQTYKAETITLDCDRPEFFIQTGPWSGQRLYDLYKSAETPYEWHKIIFDFAAKIGIKIFSTPFDESAVDLLESLDTPAYKIASFELIDLPLIEYVAKTGKPLIMSTGMASESEIEEAVFTAKKSGCNDLILLHCISSYPAPIDQANLRQIINLGKRFNLPCGLSDHTLGTVVAVAAVAQGACLIEKHFTLSRVDKGPDSEFSLEPHEFERLSNDVADSWLALGEAGFKRQISEDACKDLRRSLYFIKDLESGHVIEPGDIRSIRPGMGLAPKYLNEVIGKTLREAVKFGQPLGFVNFY